MNALDCIKSVPVLWDTYAYFWAFTRKAPRCRGAFNSYREAMAACPKSKPGGYSQKIISEHTEPAQLTAMQKIGAFDQRDYPLLVWLARAFETSSTVFDLGGNVGLGYYAYQRFVRYPENLVWTVCEIPELCCAGERIASEHKVDCLRFTRDFGRANSIDILLTCGTLQYLEQDLASLLTKLTNKPQHVLIQRVPLYDGPAFYTLQNIGYAFCPYRIQNQRQLYNSLLQLGYHLIDSWKDSRECRIPFHSHQTVSGYHGAYFSLRPSGDLP